MLPHVQAVLAGEEPPMALVEEAPSALLWSLAGSVGAAATPPADTVRQLFTALRSRPPVMASGLEVVVPEDRLALDLWSVVGPLGRWVQALRASRTTPDRLLVGFAGGAGAGKTVLAQQLRSALEVLGTPAAVVSMDGYHFPNAVLDERTFVADDGTTRPLRSIKGAPATIDVDAWVGDLGRLRAVPTAEVSLPSYDRTTHDPVPGAITVAADVGVVIVEGLYVCGAGAAPGFGAVRDQFDVVVMLDVEEAVSRRRVVARKVAGGRDADDASRHFDAVDAPTLRELATLRHLADVCMGVGEDMPLVHATVRQASHRLPATLPSTSPFPTGPNVLFVGLNPALQKTLVFDGGWERGQVNRASRLLATCGGKGQHAAIGSTMLDGVPGQVTLAQFLGGASGDAIDALLTEHGVTSVSTRTPDATRVCTTLLTGDDMTELIEPSAVVPPDAVAALLTAVQALVSDGDGLHGVALCGTYPPGCELFYETVAASFDASRVARGRPGATLLLDGYKGVSGVLGTGAVDVLKVNVMELCALVGVAEPAVGPRRESVVVSVARAAAARFGIRRCVAITDGALRALLVTADEYYVYNIPPLEAPVLNPIGAGDTVSSVFLRLALCGMPDSSAFGFGLCAASASCLSYKGAHFSTADMVALARRMGVVNVVSAPPSM